MKTSIFQYLDYRALVLDLIKLRPSGGRGERKKLATALGCQMAFVTHFLNGAKDISAEQAIKIAKYFSFKASELEYFVELVAYSRAGSAELREFYLQQLKKMQRQFESLQSRLDEDQSLSLNDQAKYYSHWLYSAIHMAATIPELQSVTALARHFHLPDTDLIPVIEFLSGKGLVKFEMGNVRPGKKHIYISSDSPFVQHHHMIWRTRLLQDNRLANSDDLQYSLCFTASEKDWPAIREVLVRSISDCLQTIRPSPEEKLGALCIDLRSL